MLATRPYPIHLHIEFASIDCNVFIESLQTRASSFMSLTLDYANFLDGDYQNLFQHLDLFEHVQVEFLPNDLIVPLLFSPVKTFAFYAGDEIGRLDLNGVSMGPKHIVLHAVSSTEFPSEFLLSFFQEVARSGHLESLKVSLCVEHAMPADVGKAFIVAILRPTRT